MNPALAQLIGRHQIGAGPIPARPDCSTVRRRSLPGARHSSGASSHALLDREPLARS